MAAVANDLEWWLKAIRIYSLAVCNSLISKSAGQIFNCISISSQVTITRVALARLYPVVELFSSHGFVGKRMDKAGVLP